MWVRDRGPRSPGGVALHSRDCGRIPLQGPVSDTSSAYRRRFAVRHVKSTAWEMRIRYERAPAGFRTARSLATDRLPGVRASLGTTCTPATAGVPGNGAYGPARAGNARNPAGLSGEGDSASSLFWSGPAGVRRDTPIHAGGEDPPQSVPEARLSCVADPLPCARKASVR